MKIDWPNIDTVLLDMDGTLLDLHFDNYFWQYYLVEIYADTHQMPEKMAEEYLTPIFEALQGTLKWYSVDYWSEELGIDIMKHKRKVSNKVAYRENAKVFLQKCNESVDDVRLITNGHRKVLDLKVELTQLDKYFHQMICSHELGAPKEQEGFWHGLQNVQGFDPHKTLFIDDSESVLDAANDYGIKHVYSIAKPDSKKERAYPSRYPMLGSDFTSE